MPSSEFQALLKTGYSKAFLQTPLGSHGKLRQRYLLSDIRPRVCKQCGDLYALPWEISEPVLNAAGTDLRFMFHGAAQVTGYCSCKCEVNAEEPKSHSLFDDT
jgi:hypothetical protein